MTTSEIVQNIGGILASGTVGAIIIAVANRWKTKSDADSGFADTYLKVKDSLNKDVDIISARFEKQIAGIVAAYEEQMRKKDIIIVQQESVIKEQALLIDDQNSRIDVLEHKVEELEKQVEAAKQIPKTIEEAREVMHHAVDVVADKLNPEIPTE